MSSQTMKIRSCIIGIFCIAAVLLNTASAVVKQCFVCPTNLEDPQKIKDCDDPFDVAKHNESSFECSLMDDFLHVEADNKTTVAAGASAATTAAAAPPARLVELQKIDTSAPWKCFKSVGVLNKTTHVVSRGCTKSCEDVQKGLTATGIVAPSCFECDTEDLCNSSFQINPIKWISFLSIAVICSGLKN